MALFLTIKLSQLLSVLCEAATRPRPFSPYLKPQLVCRTGASGSVMRVRIYTSHKPVPALLGGNRTHGFLFHQNVFIRKTRLLTVAASTYSATASVVLVVGLEPTRFSATDFESASSTYSAHQLVIMRTICMRCGMC